MLGPEVNADEFTIYYCLFVYVQLLFRLIAAMPLSVICAGRSLPALSIASPFL